MDSHATSPVLRLTDTHTTSAAPVSATDGGGLFTHAMDKASAYLASGTVQLTLPSTSALSTPLNTPPPLPFEQAPALALGFQLGGDTADHTDNPLLPPTPPLNNAPSLAEFLRTGLNTMMRQFQEGKVRHEDLMDFARTTQELRSLFSMDSQGRLHLVTTPENLEQRLTALFGHTLDLATIDLSIASQHELDRLDRVIGATLAQPPVLGSDDGTSVMNFMTLIQENDRLSLDQLIGALDHVQSAHRDHAPLWSDEVDAEFLEAYQGAANHVHDVSMQGHIHTEALMTAIQAYRDTPSDSSRFALENAAAVTSRLHTFGRLAPSDLARVEAALPLVRQSLALSDIDVGYRDLSDAVTAYMAVDTLRHRDTLQRQVDNANALLDELDPMPQGRSDISSLTMLRDGSQIVLDKHPARGDIRYVDIPQGHNDGTFVGVGEVQVQLQEIQTYVADDTADGHWVHHGFRTLGVHAPGRTLPEVTHHLAPGLTLPEAKDAVRAMINSGEISTLTDHQHAYVAAGGFEGSALIDLVGGIPVGVETPIDADWLNRTVAPTAMLYAARGDEGRYLVGSDLINEVGLAMNLFPEVTPLEGQGPISFYRSEPYLNAINPVVEAIRSIGDNSRRVATVPVYVLGEQTAQLPLFRVDTDQGAQFVDHRGWIYDSFAAWQQGNNLAATDIMAAAGGHLSTNADGKLQMQIFSNRRLDNTVKPVVGTGMMLMGTTAGVAAMIGTGGMATPLVLAAGAVYATGEGVSTLNNLAQHGQSLAWDNPEARSAYLNLMGGGLGVLAMAGAAGQLGPVAKALGIIADVGDVAELADAGQQLVANWDTMNGLQRTFAASQMLFFSAMVGAQFKDYGAGPVYTRENLDLLVNQGRGIVDIDGNVITPDGNPGRANVTGASNDTISGYSPIGTAENMSVPQLEQALSVHLAPRLSTTVGRVLQPGHVLYALQSFDPYQRLEGSIREKYLRNLLNNPGALNQLSGHITQLITLAEHPDTQPPEASAELRPSDPVDTDHAGATAADDSSPEPTAWPELNGHSIGFADDAASEPGAPATEAAADTPVPPEHDGMTLSFSSKPLLDGDNDVANRAEPIGEPHPGLAPRWMDAWQAYNTAFGPQAADVDTLMAGTRYGSNANEAGAIVMYQAHLTGEPPEVAAYQLRAFHYRDVHREAEIVQARANPPTHAQLDTVADAWQDYENAVADYNAAKAEANPLHNPAFVGLYGTGNAGNTGDVSPYREWVADLYSQSSALSDNDKRVMIRDLITMGQAGQETPAADISPEMQAAQQDLWILINALGTPEAVVQLLSNQQVDAALLAENAPALYDALKNLLYSDAQQLAVAQGLQQMGAVNVSLAAYDERVAQLTATTPQHPDGNEQPLEVEPAPAAGTVISGEPVPEIPSNNRFVPPPSPTFEIHPGHIGATPPYHFRLLNADALTPDQAPAARRQLVDDVLFALQNPNTPAGDYDVIFYRGDTPTAEYQISHHGAYVNFITDQAAPAGLPYSGNRYQQTDILTTGGGDFDRIEVGHRRIPGILGHSAGDGGVPPLPGVINALSPEVQAQLDQQLHALMPYQDGADTRTGIILEATIRPLDDTVTVRALNTENSRHRLRRESGPLLYMGTTTSGEMVAYQLRAQGVVDAEGQVVNNLPDGIAQAYLVELEQISLVLPKLSSANLRNVHLEWAEIDGGTLHGAMLNNANLSNARITEVDLGSANLSGANLHRAQIINSPTTGIILTGADLSDAWLQHINLSNVNLVKANLEEAQIAGVNLEGANLTEANLRQFSGGGIDDRSTNLTNAIFTRADLTMAILSHANLTGANLVDTTLDGADFSRAKLPGAIINGASAAIPPSMEGVLKTSVELDHADLTEAQLINVDLPEASFEGSILQKANLTNANLQKAVLISADLRGATLTNTDLRGADLAEANLAGVDLTSANLEGANLEGAIWLGAITSEQSAAIANILRDTRYAAQGENLDELVVLEMGTSREPALVAAHQLRVNERIQDLQIAESHLETAANPAQAQDLYDAVDDAHSALIDATAALNAARVNIDPNSNPTITNMLGAGNPGGRQTPTLNASVEPGHSPIWGWNKDQLGTTMIDSIDAEPRETAVRFVDETLYGMGNMMQGGQQLTDVLDNAQATTLQFAGESTSVLNGNNMRALITQFIVNPNIGPNRAFPDITQGVYPELIDTLRRREPLSLSNRQDLQDVDFSVLANIARLTQPGTTSGTALVDAKLNGANLQGANFAGLSISGTDLAGANLSGANMRGAQLALSSNASSNTVRVNLENADLSGADLREATFHGVRLAGANLDGAMASTGVFLHTDLSEVELDRVIWVTPRHLSGQTPAQTLPAPDTALLARIVDNNVPGGLVWQNYDWRGTNLSGADLSNADLRGVNLSGANLNSTRLNGARLQGAILRDTTMNSAQLNHANLSNAILERAQLNNASLIGANFAESILVDASVVGATATDTTFSGSIMRNADFSHTVFFDEQNRRSADFTYADLRGANFYDATLNRANFRKANLEDVNFQNANLPHALVDNAILHNADFNNANTDGVNFSAAREFVPQSAGDDLLPAIQSLLDAGAGRAAANRIADALAQHQYPNATENDVVTLLRNGASGDKIAHLLEQNTPHEWLPHLAQRSHAAQADADADIFHVRAIETAIETLGLSTSTADLVRRRSSASDPHGRPTLPLDYVANLLSDPRLREDQVVYAFNQLGYATVDRGHLAQKLRIFADRAEQLQTSHNTIPTGFPETIDELTRLRFLGGRATGAQLVEDNLDRRYVLKSAREGMGDNIINEKFIENIYAAAGVLVQESHIYITDTGVHKLSQYQEGQTLGAYLDSASQSERAMALARLQEGFLIDALVINWDVVGNQRNNVMVSGGFPYRVDTGIGLEVHHHPMIPGGFPPEVTELEDFFNPQYDNGWNLIDTFSGITQEQLEAQAENLQDRREDILNATPEDLRPVMDQRIDYILNYVVAMADDPVTAMRNQSTDFAIGATDSARANTVDHAIRELEADFQTTFTTDEHIALFSLISSGQGFDSAAEASPRAGMTEGEFTQTIESAFEKLNWMSYPELQARLSEQLPPGTLPDTAIQEDLLRLIDTNAAVAAWVDSNFDNSGISALAAGMGTEDFDIVIDAAATRFSVDRDELQFILSFYLPMDRLSNMTESDWSRVAQTRRDRVNRSDSGTQTLEESQTQIESDVPSPPDSNDTEQPLQGDTSSLSEEDAQAIVEQLAGTIYGTEGPEQAIAAALDMADTSGETPLVSAYRLRGAHLLGVWQQLEAQPGANPIEIREAQTAYQQAIAEYNDARRRADPLSNPDIPDTLAMLGASTPIPPSGQSPVEIVNNAIDEMAGDFNVSFSAMEHTALFSLITSGQGFDTSAEASARAGMAPSQFDSAIESLGQKLDNASAEELENIVRQRYLPSDAMPAQEQQSLVTLLQNNAAVAAWVNTRFASPAVTSASINMSLNDYNFAINRATYAFDTNRSGLRFMLQTQLPMEQLAHFSQLDWVLLAMNREANQSPLLPSQLDAINLWLDHGFNWPDRAATQILWPDDAQGFNNAFQAAKPLLGMNNTHDLRKALETDPRMKDLLTAVYNTPEQQMIATLERSRRTEVLALGERDPGRLTSVERLALSGYWQSGFNNDAEQVAASLDMQTRAYRNALGRAQRYFDLRKSGMRDLLSANSSLLANNSAQIHGVDSGLETAQASGDTTATAQETEEEAGNDALTSRQPVTDAANDNSVINAPGTDDSEAADNSAPIELPMQPSASRESPENYPATSEDHQSQGDESSGPLPIESNAAPVEEHPDSSSTAHTDSGPNIAPDVQASPSSDEILRDIRHSYLSPQNITLPHSQQQLYHANSAALEANIAESPLETPEARDHTASVMREELQVNFRSLGLGDIVKRAIEESRQGIKTYIFVNHSENAPRLLQGIQSADLGISQRGLERLLLIDSPRGSTQTLQLNRDARARGENVKVGIASSQVLPEIISNANQFLQENPDHRVRFVFVVAPNSASNTATRDFYNRINADTHRLMVEQAAAPWDSEVGSPEEILDNAEPLTPTDDISHTSSTALVEAAAPETPTTTTDPVTQWLPEILPDDAQRNVITTWRNLDFHIASTTEALYGTVNTTNNDRSRAALNDIVNNVGFSDWRDFRDHLRALESVLASDVFSDTTPSPEAVQAVNDWLEAGLPSQHDMENTAATNLVGLTGVDFVELRNSALDILPATYINHRRLEALNLGNPLNQQMTRVLSSRPFSHAILEINQIEALVAWGRGSDAFAPMDVTDRLPEPLSTTILTVAHNTRQSVDQMRDRLVDIFVTAPDAPVSQNNSGHPANTRAQATAGHEQNLHEPPGTSAQITSAGILGLDIGSLST